MKKKKITTKNLHRFNKMSGSDLESFRATLKNQSVNGQLQSFPMERTPLAFSLMPGETNNDSTIFMGFEWENLYSTNTVTGPSGTTYPLNLAIMESVKDNLGEYMNFRSDGGVEMVSIPATLEFHKDFLEREFFEKNVIPPTLIDPHQTNGLHIHTGHNAWSSRALARYIALMMQPDNIPFFTAFGRRPYNSYSPVVHPNFKFAKPSMLDGKTIQRVVGMDIKINNNMHQTAGVAFVGMGSRQIIHCQSTHGTVELRLFRAPRYTHMKQDLFSSLEYMDAAIRYCRKATFNRTHILDFIGYIEDNAKRYPYLYADPHVQGKLREALAASLARKKQKA